MNWLSILSKATLQVFTQKNYKIGLIFIALVVFALFVYIPVRIIPGNDIAFQLSIMPAKDYVIFTIISLLTALLFMFNIYIFRQRQSINVHDVGNVTFSGVSGIVASLLGGITCVACSSTVISFIGVGTIAVLFKYKLLITLITLLTMTVALYYNARRILYLCNECHVEK